MCITQTHETEVFNYIFLNLLNAVYYFEIYFDKKHLDALTQGARAAVTLQ